MGTYKIVSHSGTGLPLNVAATSTISGRTNVNIWNDTGSNDQRWSIVSLSSNQQVKTLNNLSYMLNANTSTWNCDVMTANTDAYVNFIQVSTGVYRLQLKSNTAKYLTAGGSTSGSSVTWQALNSTSNAQKWAVSTAPTPVGPKKHTYINDTATGLVMIKTDASNITMKNLQQQQDLAQSSYFGINGGMFNMSSGDRTIALNIAYTDGQPVGPKGSGATNGWNGSGVIYWNNSTLNSAITQNASDIISSIGSSGTWAQGGFSLHLGNKNWTTLVVNEICPSGYATYVSTGRTALVADKTMKQVYLIVTRKKVSPTAFRTAIQSYFGISDGTSDNSRYIGLCLDGSDSSQLKAKQSDGSTVVSKSSYRALCQLITLRDAN